MTENNAALQQATGVSKGASSNWATEFRATFALAWADLGQAERVTIGFAAGVPVTVTVFAPIPDKPSSAVSIALISAASLCPLVSDTVFVDPS